MASRRKVDTRYTESRLLWSCCLQVFLSAGAQGNSHPAESSKVCELDEGGVLTHATQALYVAMVLAHTREFCLVDWALLPLSTKR